MPFPRDHSGIPFLDMEPAERTALIHKLYSEGKMPVPGAGSSGLGPLEILEPAFDIAAGLMDAATGIFDELF